MASRGSSEGKRSAGLLMLGQRAELTADVSRQRSSVQRGAGGLARTAGIYG
jgi:hypothetical protein